VIVPQFGSNADQAGHSCPPFVTEDGRTATAVDIIIREILVVVVVVVAWLTTIVVVVVVAAWLTAIVVVMVLL
jgi:hypothetical protein